MKLDQDFIKKVSPAIFAVWGAIAPDVQVDGNEEAIELCLDADRLPMFVDGGAEIDALISAAEDEHGYDVVSDFLAANIILV